MITIVALLGDYWHNAEDAMAGLESAVSRLPNRKNINLQYITHEEVLTVLNEQPDLFINGKIDQLNPTDDKVYTWLTDELDKKIVSYVENGGSAIAWHAGMAGYKTDSNYIQLLRGYFDYHPPGLQEVTYMLKEDETSGENTFTLSDEQYFVHCDVVNTEVDLWSTGADGDSLAGWKHPFGEGKVCCFTPAHTKEGMLNENINRLLAEKISWALTK
ncbi:ThuA domain-containing protein [Evansella tamaricis]|uniref:ThuA domain-containing protein n=1 Tax=Evansella tamaricis TaxID=2069301 RepID=A0ABS6JHP2_9BACI|nr:ThuA domain-containing protein [Evansella tamaricis]MBU9713043.1 ThuA domain-containing protein [Evansella tamaricis]